MCRLLFERIDDSKGRIVVVGSLAYKMGLKRIKFEDINFDQKYSPWDAYAQSKLALMMFAYELHRRVKRAGKHIQVQVCHPGASRTHLIKRDNIRLDVKILFTLLSPFIAQSAEKGAWPEVMCATEEELAVEKLYGPTKRGQLVGPIGECSLDNNVLNREEAAQLWTLSEEKTSQHWPI